MLGSKQRGPKRAITAEGLVEVNGQIDGKLHCTSLVIARGAHVNGIVAAERVVVDGKVEGPIQGGDVVLKSQAHVVGDIHHQSLAIERGQKASPAGPSGPNLWKPTSRSTNASHWPPSHAIHPRSISGGELVETV